jgi:hypothetical protein
MKMKSISNISCDRIVEPESGRECQKELSRIEVKRGRRSSEFEAFEGIGRGGFNLLVLGDCPAEHMAKREQH